MSAVTTLRDPATILRAAQALADDLMVPGVGRCALTADKGDEGRPGDRMNHEVGRCSGYATAFRWEDGFLDRVCDKHAASAEQRGALVIRPERHDGTGG